MEYLFKPLEGVTDGGVHAQVHLPKHITGALPIAIGTTTAFAAGLDGVKTDRILVPRSQRSMVDLGHSEVLSTLLSRR